MLHQANIVLLCVRPAGRGARMNQLVRTNTRAFECWICYGILDAHLFFFFFGIQGPSLIRSVTEEFVSGESTNRLSSAASCRSGPELVE